MVACSDYTKGNANLIAGSDVVGLFVNMTKGTSNSFSSEGISMPNQFSSYLKYVSTNGVLNNNYSMEFGLDGTDLVRGTGKYFILHGGSDLMVFLDNGLLKVQSDKKFITQNEVSLSVSQQVISTANTLSLDRTKKYTVKIDVRDNSNISIQIRETLSTNTQFTTVLSGKTSSNMSSVSTACVGSTLANSLTFGSAGPWGGNIQFFRVFNNTAVSSS